MGFGVYGSAIAKRSPRSTMHPHDPRCTLTIHDPRFKMHRHDPRYTIHDHDPVFTIHDHDGNETLIDITRFSWFLGSGGLLEPSGSHPQKRFSKRPTKGYAGSGFLEVMFGVFRDATIQCVFFGGPLSFTFFVVSVSPGLPK